MNNIAWLIRRFPFFPIFGSGNYKVQSIFAGDVAKIAVDAVDEPSGKIIDAIGPETFTFEEMVHLIAKKIGRSPLFMHVPPQLGILLGKIIGLFQKDVILTRDELTGLMQSLLTSTQTPDGNTLFSRWLEENKETVGSSYTSELGRHFKYPFS